ncbi:peptidoglycan DD-metalloendopeptidase family protein [Actibacterium lipolyticum]|uniref:Murein hydrolase activator NlpD n=1 Tax=Actibacterium lipolyticum TaxID=1524263 RepID=A0A238JWJ1_9RHOB|nr:peptidoglycan DD-metalloendopeptidase family protein [Actibacterium lipolyticum]SMX34192.1 Murein hydrolase activator NlpD precursor [Actibacterium lipolyticum]
MPTLRPVRLRALLLGCAALAVTACDDFDIDLRNNAANTSQAALQETAPRPEPDARGIISYPSYQVAVAKRGDTVSDVANRVGLTTEELSRYNGIPMDVTLRKGEILALPKRVDQPTPAPSGNIDIATLAGSAIERAGTTTATPAPVRQAPTAEPIRHKVERGETAYSIARLYNVSVRSLSEWNGLGTELTVREGQYLLIPVAVEDKADAAPEVVVATLPGAISAVPTPPSAASPLPDEETTPPAAAAAPAPATATTTTAAAAPTPVAAAPIPSPQMVKEKTVSSRLAFPVDGSIIRGYEKKKNDGIDISAAAGTPVKAAEAGTVAAITRDTDQIPILVLRHEDNLLTVYANIDTIKVEKGDTVKRGETVATVRAGDPSFLHFEVRQGFESVDPMPYLN